MATPRPTRRPDLEIHLGASGLVVGRLHLGSGRRSAFSYDEGWLRDARFFTLSPDLQPVAGVQHPRQVFFLALEDTAPDAWGERVIRRAHAKLRQEDRDTPALDPVDFVMWVDDEARVGALRLFDPQSGAYLRAAGANRQVPPLVELEKVLHAARALEDGTESAQDLRYLLGQGTSLGGARPKSTVRDTDGRLAVGKFPSQADRRDVIRGEVLAMQLAAKAGIRVSPAFDLNPMPGDRRESKTWLTEDTGVIDSRDMLMAAASYFRLDAAQAQAIWNEVAQAVAGWRALARRLGMRGTDLLDFEPAFVESTTP
ncbi:type II toxin-antitoxin system HipA family toxin [Pseudomonas aeruginosa]|uniref:HipA N-terminal domain-containing protein n=1 Tax=Pseudomonas aeruginosa TaxID=287 RepID=UPI001248A5EF|nr:HipA N-terminal domain-containing protein [Pseudomonas aeruginosa]KAB0757224.1 type II toxin-antitoxin system HipA family toxin [Pseudomonas aeruginosa]MCW5481959.1 HipA N-terminal domain-containing protein [Pseudomonas aeruginosa]